MSEYHSEISTRVPLCIATSHGGEAPRPSHVARGPPRMAPRACMRRGYAVWPSAGCAMKEGLPSRTSGHLDLDRLAGTCARRDGDHDGRLARRRDLDLGACEASAAVSGVFALDLGSRGHTYTHAEACSSHRVRSRPVSGYSW